MIFQFKFKKYCKKHRNSTKIEVFQNKVKLSYALISGEFDNRKTPPGQENCHKKEQKMMKIIKFFIFLESSQNEARSISKLSERDK